MMLGRKRERSAWVQRAILIGACLTYVLGYAAVRSDHFLVHGTSLVKSADGQGARVVAHDIRPGDFGVPKLGPATAIAMTGSFVVEKVFAVPGIGRHFVDGVLAKDITLIMGVVLVYATMLVVFNLLVDVFYSWVDPRIRVG